ncbi:MAG: valine--tRNA ligase [Candidatus Saccharimonadales bacterium]|jgi:valyl-tRNA synthetase
MKLPKTYNPTEYEAGIYTRWEKSGAFKADPNSPKPHFSISMPPPNETSTLHMGGALFLTLQDIMIRHARQQGKDALWLPGTDHAAIATNAVVERQLVEQGTDKHQIGREAFIAKVKEFAGSNRETMISQMRAMGASCDWSRFRYTLDDSLSRSVNEVFTKMYKDGLIYRGHRIVNWDPNLETTVSDDEVDYKEEKAPLYTLQYGPFQISTARPETKFGDKYVVVHPEDKRYKHYSDGQTFETEWLNGTVTATVVKDEAVDPEFGTGVMTITPWHDRTDFEIAERHGLEREQIIDYKGKLLPIAGEFAGMGIEEARPKIVKKLKAKGLLVDVDENYSHSIALNSRGQGVIEPQIMLQWFVDVNRPAMEWKGQMRSFREVMRTVVEDGDIKIIPKRFEKIYYHWIDNLRDWCISRQIWWGHQIPVWYKKTNQPVMGFDQTVMNQMLNGKTKTYRQKDYGYKPGDKILVENSQTGIVFGEITIKSVQKTTVEKVDLADKAHFVVYKDPSELIAALKKYHPERQMDLDYPIWVYEYDFEPKEIEDEIYVGVLPPEGQGWKQDPDTLDTWFSSALWTWSTLIDPKLAEDYSLSLEDLLERSVDFKSYHPTDVLETAYDILFFWVARMILATTYVTGQIPFRTVYLHGLVRTETGKKMSKSDPDTIIDPLDVIKQYGTDALRLAVISGTGAGNDQRLGLARIVANRNFCNKLWNIARYIEGVVGEDYRGEAEPKSPVDHWILNKLSISAKEISADLGNFKFGEAYSALYHFVWDDLADWYVEASKTVPNVSVLAYVLDQTLKLAHPFAPFVTETVWQQLGWHDTMLISEQWPKIIDSDKTEANKFEGLKLTITEVRWLKAMSGIRADTLYHQPAPDMTANSKLVAKLAGLKEIKELPPGYAGGLRLISVNLDCRLDVDATEAKVSLEVKLKEAQTGESALSARLKKPGYKEKAPKELIEQTEKDLAEAGQKIEQLQKILQNL